MTWREFQLRLEGYKREKKEREALTREISYMVYLGIPQKEPKLSKDRFWNIEGWGKAKGGLSEMQKELLKKAQIDALNGK